MYIASATLYLQTTPFCALVLIKAKGISQSLATTELPNGTPRGFTRHALPTSLLVATVLCCQITFSLLQIHPTIFSDYQRLFSLIFKGMK